MNARGSGVAQGLPFVGLSYVSMLFWSMLFVLCFLGLGRDLWTPDEPREAEISREMLLAPSVVPSLNGRDFIEKPPLYYWTVAGVFAVLKPSAAAARGVSAGASFLTLVLVFLWGQREFSTRVGLIAAFGLATSLQFAVSSHWIVIDPLLMLFTTVALWVGSELVRGRSSIPRFVTFYGALALAMWTKGLIGPLLVACGLATYAALRRSLTPLWSLRPFTGTAVMVLVAASIAVLIYVDSDAAQVREWLWVNHVQRFIDPGRTAHDQPFYYYLAALPIAVFPWWAPFVALFRPSTWRGEPSPHLDAKVVLGAICLGMLLLLGASATKRELYLLPMLPPLSVLLAAQAEAWWARRPQGELRGAAWWFQVTCVVLFATVPTILVLAHLQRTSLQPVDRTAAVFLTLVAALTAAVVVLAWRGRGTKALGALGACVVAAVVGLLVVDTRLLAPVKDMTPFVARVGEQLPHGSPVYATGDIDETLDGIVPFVTGRVVVSMTASDIDKIRPRYVLVQDKKGGRTAPQPGAAYALLEDRHFGPGRYMALWRRRPTDVSQRR
ncbi:ArnT family glycosyltransferase [Luteimonas salinilitoris]|uniref:ArnT family glycosyltransferase n=1 Tax=Luteimonas salinilitoris TaxID=3237697 RepID=A0ABV4HNU7_9GAMM